jgi:hypothetical protein
LGVFVKIKTKQKIRRINFSTIVSVFNNCKAGIAPSRGHVGFYGPRVVRLVVLFQRAKQGVAVVAAF